MRLSLGILVFLAFALSVRYGYVVRQKGALRHEAALIGRGEGPQPARAKTLVFEDGGAAVLSGYEQFHFDLSSHAPILSDNNRDFLAALAQWMAAHPQRTVTVTGRFYDRETRPDNRYFQNLGLARAAAVRDLLVKEHGADGAFLRLDHRLVVAPARMERSPVDAVQFRAER
jgi:outer membrane protein OmpA-like peptidoglycan-associated protein